MADIRIKDLTTTASSTASDDFIAVDGATNGTRKLNAYSPSFGGNATVVGTLTVNGTSGHTFAGPLIGQGTTFTGYQFLAKDTGSTAVGAAYALQTSGGTDKWRWGLRGPAGSLTDSLIFSYFNGSWSEALTLSNTGVVSVPSTTASTSTSTGALVVSGGVGVAGALYAGGSIRVVGSSHTTRFRQDDAIIDFSNTAENAYVTGTISGNTLQLKGNNGTGLTIGTTGNLLIGTTTDSSNGKLQLTTHTTSAGGIGFGTDVSLYRSGANTLTFNTSGNAAVLNVSENATLTAAIGTVTGDLYLQTQQAGKSVYIKTGNAATALTLNSSQQVQVNATTASTSTSTGALVVSGGVGVAGAIYAGNAINATVNGSASIIGRNGSASSFTSVSAYSGASDEIKGTLTSSTAGVIIVGSQTNHPLAVYVNNAEVARWDTSANFQTRVTGTAPSLATNSTMTFELTSNTSLKIFVRGSDGTTRSTTLTLA